MGNLANFDRFFIIGQGQALGYIESYTLKYDGKDIPVSTLLEELAGKTKVPKKITLSATSFVPDSGFGGFDVIKLYLSGDFVSFEFKAASGLSMKTDGWIDEPSISVSATDSTKLTFEATLKAKGFEGAII